MLSFFIFSVQPISVRVYFKPMKEAISSRKKVAQVDFDTYNRVFRYESYSVRSGNFV